MSYKISIIGSGSWGSALAQILSDNKHQVLMYDVDKNIVNEINSEHTNKSKFEDAKLNDDIKATSDLAKAVNFGDLILLAVPTAVIRSVLERINKVIEDPKLFVNVAKGIEPETFKRVSEIVFEEIAESKRKGYVVLTGPSHAEEVVLGMLTLVTAASNSLDDAKLVQKIFSNKENFRVYTSTDLIGAELCGSLKNVIALASGMAYALNFGDNSKAALITRGLVEIKRIVLALGGKMETVYGLSGVGDLIVTCTSFHSRNFQAGIKIAQGKNLKQTLSEITMVVEGARTAVAAHQIIKEYKISAPIIEGVYEIVYKHKDVKKAIANLMARSLKSE